MDWSTIVEDYIAQILLSPPNRPQWNIEYLRHGREPQWNYIDGCFLTALTHMYHNTHEEKYMKYVINYLDYYVREGGEIIGYDIKDYNIDNISGGRVLFDAYEMTGNNKFLKAIELIYRQLLTHPRTVEGNFWHKKIYPHQVWLDGLYMGQVFYNRYDSTFNGGSNHTDILNQFESVRKLMYDSDKKLYYHGYDSSKKAFWCRTNGCSKSFWLRAMGWYCAGLADVFEYTSDNVDISFRKRLAQLLSEALEGLISYVDEESGMFYQVVDRGGEDGNYLETSGSCLVAYAMVKAVRMGIVGADYLIHAQKCFEGVCSRYLRIYDSGMHLDGICLMAGLGPENNRRRDGTYEYYISEPIVSDDAKGVAPFIMLYTELKGLDGVLLNNKN